MPYSKAKSGLTATRQYWEHVLEPPNLYTVGSTSFISSIRDGRGHSEYHVAIVNNNAFTLQIRHSWRTTGAFTEDQTIASVVDPVTGLHVAEIVSPVVKRYLRAYVTGTVLGAAFECGWYFQPRASGPTVTSGAAGGGADITIIGNRQAQTVETTVPLAAAAVFDGAAHDCINYEGFAASLHLIGGAVGTVVQLALEARDSAAATWRVVETHNIVIGAGALVWFSRVWATIRRFQRVELVNTTANALAETELVTLRKPVA